MRVENLWEDWYSFEVALKNGAKIPNKEKVLDILGKEKDNERRKSQIIALDKGYTWHRIIRDIFPPFRNARMAIVCHERSERIPVNVERLSFDYSLPVREPVSSFPMNTTENRARRGLDFFFAIFVRFRGGFSGILVTIRKDVIS